jgi:phage/plasmid-associated DNA primase
MAHSAETKTVEPMFKLCMLFNEFPTLENPYDGGFLRRFVGIHFPNRFIEGEPQRPNEYKRDPSLKEKIKTNIAWRQQYMLLLLENLREYRQNGETLMIPDQIKSNTKELLSQQDPIEEFVKTELMITGNEKNIILRTDLWKSFKEYMKMNYQNQKMGMKLVQFQERIMKVFPADVEFKARCSMNLGDSKQTYLNCFLGVRWQNEEEVTIEF